MKNILRNYKIETDIKHIIIGITRTYTFKYDLPLLSRSAVIKPFSRSQAFQPFSSLSAVLKPFSRY